MNKIIHFIKYHNAFTIGLAFILFLMAGTFASEDARDAVIGEKVENVQGIDNSLILAADLDNFDFQMIIKDVKEDAKNYYLVYDYQTLAIQENAWRGVLKNNSLTVSKARLGNRDLGLYAQEELGENLDRELKYLKEVQAIERVSGETQLTISTDYTGLVGLVLDIKDKIFPAYEPVVKPAVVEPISGASTPGASAITPTPQICRNGENRPCSSQIGACRIGVEICTDGAWGDCIGAVFPTDEIFDLVDNNCDGQIDEGLIAGEPISGASTQIGFPDIEQSATTTEPISEEIVEPESIATSTEQIIEPLPEIQPVATSTIEVTNAATTP